MPKMAVFNLKEVARLFGVTVDSVRNWIDDPGGLRAVKVNGMLYVSEDEVRRYYRIKHGHDTLEKS